MSVQASGRVPVIWYYDIRSSLSKKPFRQAAPSFLRLKSAENTPSNNESQLSRVSSVTIFLPVASVFTLIGSLIIPCFFIDVNSPMTFEQGLRLRRSSQRKCPQVSATPFRGSPYHHCPEQSKLLTGKENEGQTSQAVFHTDQGFVCSSQAFQQAHEYLTYFVHCREQALQQITQ